MTEANNSTPEISDSTQRKGLFLEMAGRREGVSVHEVYERALQLGDTVTEEAYYNLARRLVHRGLLVPDDSSGENRYRLGAHSEAQWLEEEQLCAIIDPEYPLPALTIWKEAQRQIKEIPEAIWEELRERLKFEPAQDLFRKAILSYCDDLHAQVAILADTNAEQSPEFPKVKKEAESTLSLLVRLGKYGLGLSHEALSLPPNVDTAIKEYRAGHTGPYVDGARLALELQRRIAPEHAVVEVSPDQRESGRPLSIGAVDGSMRGGILSFLGEEGDLALGHAPMIVINTSVGQLNKVLKHQGKQIPLFLRLPEKPEDMQRQDNRYSVMAKLFFPDLSDAEYMHSVWNAMDLLEARAALRLLDRWYAPKSNYDVPPSDVVLRDGAASPQDRDFHHYALQTTYGKIVRDLISTNWKIVQKCRDDGQTLAGVVKAAHLTVFGPVINWFACQVAMNKKGQLQSWPLAAMNLLPDQVLLTRLLTSGRQKKDPWVRTCVIMRPFHATTNYAQGYSHVDRPTGKILRQHEEALKNLDSLDADHRLFWQDFRGESDPYVKMLESTYYASFYLGALPRLDLDKNLPRMEFLVPAPTSEDSPTPWDVAIVHRDRLILAISRIGFDVSAEHSMFASAAKLDVLPKLLIQVHDTVKHWAADLVSRVQEFVGFYLARYVKSKKLRGIKVRPFTRQELEFLYAELRSERDRLAGEPRRNQLPGG
jgi:hypothetical protein